MAPPVHPRGSPGRPLELAVDAEAPDAPYVQLRSGIADRVADGRLLAGDRLPTVRGLAAELGIAPGTVARAYRELEEAGLVETRGRQGSFVRAQNESRARVRAAADALAATARAAGVPADEALELARRALGR